MVFSSTCRGWQPGEEFRAYNNELSSLIATDRLKIRDFFTDGEVNRTPRSPRNLRGNYGSLATNLTELEQLSLSKLTIDSIIK